MRSTRACATLIGLPTSNTSQSPAQKSNCRYAGATQEPDFGDSTGATRPAVRPLPARRTTMETVPIFKHRVTWIIVISVFPNVDKPRFAQAVHIHSFHCIE